MYTVVLTADADGNISGRVEDANIAAQNCVGEFETREEAIAAMNKMPELAAK